jgi:transcriptional regulator
VEHAGALLLTYDKSLRMFLSSPDRSHLPPPAMPSGTPEDVLQGTLELLILRTLSLEPMHGWGITQRIKQLSEDAFQVGQGSLYPALQRLEKKGWISSDWGTTENNRRAKYYELTAPGRRALGAELESWRRFAGAVELVLAGTLR